MSNYSYTKKVTLFFDETIQKTKEILKTEGFGVLTEIDVKKTLKEKLGEEFNDYMILGACNPPFAFEALKAEKEIGIMLPCNVIVYSDDIDTVFVSAILPTVAMSMIENPLLKEIAEKVESKLKKVVDLVHEA